MRRSVNTTPARTVAAVLALGTFVAGCSDLYLDRRETVALGGGDAVALNRVVQTIDPWPPTAADRTYANNGDKMQSAAERYRTGKIIQPKGLGTTSTWAQPVSSDSGGADSTVGAAKSSK